MSSTGKLQPLQYTENQMKVLSLIMDSGGITRSKIAESTGFSNLTVIKYTSQFIHDGIVIESGTEDSTGGRKASILSVNPDYGYVLAADIGAYSAKIGAVRFDGSILEYESIIHTNDSIPMKTVTPDELMRKFRSLIGRLGEDRFIGLGIGISGLVDYESGKIKFCPNVDCWNNIDVKEAFGSLGLPVYADTSARCMALAEQRLGAGKGFRNQVFVSIGYSIGAGIIMGGRLFRGASGSSGELGHVTAITGGSLCSCGNYGCLENYATLPMILTEISENLNKYKGFSPLKELLDAKKAAQKFRMPGSMDSVDNLRSGVGGGSSGNGSSGSSGNSISFSHLPDIADIQAGLEKNDKIVLESMYKAGNLLGTVLANMTNTLNPDLIVLGGGLIENFPVIVTETERVIKKQSLVSAYQDLSVRKSILGFDSAIIGSALQVINTYFEPLP